MDEYVSDNKTKSYQHEDDGTEFNDIDENEILEAIKEFHFINLNMLKTIYKY
tara:strand:+ start:134 stop:289 length:156 start_codon:yes stop_codon:yes gene_type:complete